MQTTVTMTDGNKLPAIKTKKLGKTYPNGTVALRDINLTIGNDEFVVIIGLSGAGKSTLLRCINRLIRPTCGQLYLYDKDITGIGGRKLMQVRRRAGMIFQQFHLVRRLSVLENVLVGRLRFNANPVNHILSMFRLMPKQEKEYAFECLKQVGIADLAFQRADTLSGGQQQRVAIARALAQEPKVFLADEPIASLDPKSADTVMQALKSIHETQNIPVIVNLHHIDFAQQFGKRILGMSRGTQVFDGKSSDLDRETIECVYGSEAKEQIDDLAVNA